MASSTAKRIKLKQFAAEQGISYPTAYRHWKAGNMRGVQLPGGLILVDGWKNTEVEDLDEDTTTVLAVIYSRVGNSSQTEDLKRQTEKLKKFATEQSYEVVEVIEEVAIAFSDRRPKLLNLLHRKDWDVLLIENEASLVAFGFPYIEVLLKDRGQEIMVAAKSDGTQTTLDGEYHMIGLLRRVREFLKQIIGYAGQKGQITSHINELMK